jgi:hypothetical protein
LAEDNTLVSSSTQGHSAGTTESLWRQAGVANCAWRHELPLVRSQPDDSIAPARSQNVVPHCGRKKFPLFFSNRGDILTALIFWKQFLNRGRFETMPPDESIGDSLFGGKTCS